MRGKDRYIYREINRLIYREKGIYREIYRLVYSEKESYTNFGADHVTPP